MKIALAQFAVSSSWQDNLARCSEFISQARENGASLVVLPEGILSRDAADPDHVIHTAQALDGPFLSGLCLVSGGISVCGCINVPDGQGRYHNTLVVIQDGVLTTVYRKLHLYDAFSMQESRLIAPGNALPPVIAIDGVKYGFMTCYDVRFPEVARHLALEGADVLVVPAAWLRGAGKERHWEILLAARALENTCYVLGAGECGPANIGHSMVIDPLGVVIAAQGAGPGLLMAEIDPERIALARRHLPVLQNRRFAAPILQQNK